MTDDLALRHPVGAVLSVRVPADLAASLDEDAAESGLTLSEYVRAVLERRRTMTGGSLAVTVPARGVTVSPDLAAALPPATCYRVHTQPDEHKGVVGAVWLADVRRALAALPASPDAKPTANDARVSREALVERLLHYLNLGCRYGPSASTPVPKTCPPRHHAAAARSLLAALPASPEDGTYGETTRDDLRAKIDRELTRDGQLEWDECSRLADLLADALWNELSMFPVARPAPALPASPEDGLEDGLIQRAHVPCCWCGEHHEEGR